MLTKNYSLYVPSLSDAIDRHPLIVSPDTNLLEVLAKMSQHRVNCEISLSQENEQQNPVTHLSSSCVLVIENSQIKGILTVRDLVILTANNRSFAKIRVSEVMKTLVISLKQTGTEDIFTALSLFRQHSIRQAPVIDSNNNLVGVVTSETLRGCLEAHNLMRLQHVSEVMTKPVITAPPTMTLQKIAEIMANNSISCVVIANEYKTPRISTSKKLKPIGIITEGDILQLQNLQIDLSTRQVGEVMSAPVFCLHPQDSIWQAKMEMEKHCIKHLAVTNNDGELLGIVTQTNLLRSLDAVQMFGVIEALQKQICQLQIKNIELLETCSQNLENKPKKRKLKWQIALQQAELFERLQTELAGRKRAEAQVQETQKLLDLFYQSSCVGICITDDEGCFIRVNSAFCNLCGYQESELLGQTFTKLLPPKSRRYALELYSNFLEAKTPTDSEWQVRRVDNKVLDIYLTASPVVEENGERFMVTTVADISERKQAEQALKLSEERYRALVELSPDGIFISQKGIFRFVNTAVVKMLGYGSADELIGRPVLEVINPKFHKIVKKRINLLENYGINAGWLDEKFIGANGLEIDVEVGATVIHLEGELACQVVIRDITIRKQAEEALRKSEERYRQIVETAMEGVWLIDENSKTSFVNQRMAEMLGYQVDEMMGKCLFDFMDNEGLVIANRNIERRRHNISEQHDFKFVRKDGKSLYAIVSTNPFLDAAGNYVGALAMITDITDRKRAEQALENLNEELQIRVSNRTVELAEAIQQLQQEIYHRKQAQQELFLLKERLQYLLSSSPAVIYSCQIEGSYAPTFISENISGILGYPVKDFFDNPDFWATHIHPEDADRIFAELPAFFQSGMHSHEYRFLAKNGEYRWIRDDLRLARDLEGNPVEIVGCMIDITEQKQAEAKLQNALFELEFQNFALDQSAIIAITDTQGVISYVNQKFCEISGYPKEELIGQTHRIINSGEHPKAFFEEMWATISQGKLWKGEIKNQAKNGRFYWVDTTILPVLDSQRKPVKYLSIRIDITERKKTEEDLRKSEERFALAVEGVKDGIWDWDLNTNIVYFSPQWKRMLGCSDDEITNNYEEWEKRIHPDDRQIVSKTIQDYLYLNLPVYEIEHRLLHQDGSYRWILTRGAALRSSTGTPYRMAGSHTDITERKQVESALFKHRQYLTAIVEIQRQLLAAPVDKNLYKKILQILGPVSDASRIYIFENHRDAKGHLLTSQRAEWCSADVAPQIDNPTLQNCPYNEFAPRWEQILSSGDILQGNVADLPDVERETLEMQGILSILVLPLTVQGHFFGFIGFDNCSETRDWEPLEISLLISVASAIALAKERQLTQEALQQQLAAVEAATDGIAILNKNSEYIYLNNSHIKLFGYEKPEQLLGKSWPLLYSENEAKHLQKQVFRQLLKTGHWRGKTIGKKQDNSLFPLEVSLTLIEDRGLICVCQDITHRKKAEEALQQAKDQLQAVLDAVPGLVFWIDSDLRYVGVNRHLAAMFSLAPENFVGQDIGFLKPKTEFCKFFREFFAKPHQTASQSITLEVNKQTRSYLMVAQKYHASRACVSVGIDITDRKQAEEQLQASLREKEVLLKEIHHRVKNNLQVISSLLKLQSRYTQDSRTLDMLRESQNRVKSMALIHEKLYQSTNLASIDFADYIQNLASNLLYSYSVNTTAVKLEIKTENVSLNIDTAIPCGLLINELVSNAFKHAFPEGSEGNIWIDFYSLPEQVFLLSVKDNGIGFPQHLDWQNSGSLGLRLVNSLVNQLDGSLEIDRTEGTKFEIKFRELLYKQRN